MTISYRTFRNLTMIGVLGAVGGFGYGLSEATNVTAINSNYPGLSMTVGINIENSPELTRIVKINSELKDISRVLDDPPIRVFVENPDSLQHYMAMVQREGRLKEEHDSLSALPVIQKAQKKGMGHFYNMMYGLGGFFAFGALGIFSGMGWSDRRREHEDAQKA